MKKTINTDDFGISEGVSLGIISLMKSNKVNSTSVMVCCDFNKGKLGDELLQLRKDKSVKIGLHLTLTGNFTPLFGSKSLLAGKYFKNPSRQFKDCLLGNFNMEDLEMEIKSQIFKFYDFFGFFPDHIDSHHYIHQNPIVARSLVYVLCVNNIFNTRVINCATSLVFCLRTSPSEFLKILFLHFFGILLKRRLKRSNIKTNSHFYGLYPMRHDALINKGFASYYKKYLKNMENNDVLGVHPAFLVDKELELKDSLTHQRVVEFSAIRTFKNDGK